MTRLMRAGVVSTALLLACAACHRAPDAGPGAPQRPAKRTESTCPSCGARAGPAHICGVTYLCDVCSREAGPGHICGKTRFCRECGRETARFPIRSPHVCGLTRPCMSPECAAQGVPAEAGPGHVCGHTHLCLQCRREVGENHNCTAGTAFCAQCLVEMDPAAHTHGRSAFCADRKCRVEASVAEGEHRHGETRWCAPCGREVPRTHSHAPGGG